MALSEQPQIHDNTAPVIDTVNDDDVEESREEGAASGGQDQPEQGQVEEERSVGDLPGASISAADQLLDAVYGDHVHQNPGTHLDGGIADDKTWQNYYRRLIIFPSSNNYDAPTGAVRCCFIQKVASILAGIKDRKWNSECLLVFTMVITQRSRGVTRARDIRKRFKHRMDAWDAGKFDMLVQSTERDMSAYLRSKQGETTADQ